MSIIPLIWLKMIMLGLKCRPFLFIISVILVLSSCSNVQKNLSFIPGVPNPDATKIRFIQILTNQNGRANQNSATQMDVLFILDNNLASNLPLTAADWFEERSRYLTNNSQSIIVSSISLPPDGRLKLSLPKGYKDAKDVIAYANYLSDQGQKWLRLPNTKSVSIELDTLDWTFSTN